MTVKLTEFPFYSKEKSAEPDSKISSTVSLLTPPFPSFTLADLPIQVFRQQLPSYLFKRCTRTSFFYLLHDIAFVSLTFYLATWIDTLTHFYQWPKVVLWALWICYSIVQGVFCTGLWVIAHECGHQAFSPYKQLNNAVGFILHSCLLVPYHAWRITHSSHHKHTNHLTKDQIFIPTIEAKEDAFFELESPLLSFFYLLRMLVGGWPAYLLWNVSGQQYEDWQSHFFPTSRFFEPHHYSLIVVSNLGVLGMALVYAWCGYEYGVSALLKYFVGPYLHVNMWLVIITYLQHTHEEVPYYNEASFTFLRGAFSTIDRDYGILNHFFHHIGDSHRVHHMFSTMPHYHAIQATRILKFPKDSTPIFVALWNTYRYCKRVSEHPRHENMFWYKQIHKKFA